MLRKKQKLLSCFISLDTTFPEDLGVSGSPVGSEDKMGVLGLVAPPQYLLPPKQS